MGPDQLVRSLVKDFAPYSSARNEFKGKAQTYLDANENPFAHPYSRYPDPLQQKLTRKIAEALEVNPNSVILGNGSDELIDLILRAVCEPGKDGVLLMPPTYGMYAVSARLNNLHITEIPLDSEFQPSIELITSNYQNSKVLFICSPNNPTGNSMKRDRVISILENFPGLVVLDEAYAEFSTEASLINDIEKYPNLFVLKTLSKAWGSAGIRLGIGVAQPGWINYLLRIKPPYNIGDPTANAALRILENSDQIKKEVALIVKERQILFEFFRQHPAFETVYPSGANFLLVKSSFHLELLNLLLQKGIVVRNRDGELNCDKCLRITVGTPEENRSLMDLVSKWKN